MVFKRIITYFDIANAIVIEDIEGFFVPIFICCLGGLIISITSFVFLLLLLFKRTNFTHFVKCSYEEYKEARQKKKAEKEAKKKAEKKEKLQKQLQEIEKEP